MNLSTCALALGLAITSIAPQETGGGAVEVKTQARPGPAPGSYEITPAAESIRIPFELKDSELELIGDIGGEEVRILIDNGVLWDQLLFFGSPRVDDLRLVRDGTIQVGGAGSGDPLTADTASGIDIRFEGEDGRAIEFHEQDAVILPYVAGQSRTWNAEGQISSALFKNFVVGFDFDAGIMTLTTPKAFDPEGKGDELPMKPVLDSVSWILPGTLTLHDGRELELDMAIDLGWNEALALNTDGKNAIGVPEGLTRKALGAGTQGAIYGYHGTVPRLQVGDYLLQDLPATYSSVADGGAKDSEVMVGLGTFARFNVCFDYRGHRILMKPNQKFADTFVPR